MNYFKCTFLKIYSSKGSGYELFYVGRAFAPIVFRLLSKNQSLIYTATPVVMSKVQD